MSDANAHDNTYNGSSSEATVTRLMDSLSLFTTCFQSLQTVWTQKIADTLGIFTYLKRILIHVYEPDRCFVQNWNDFLKCRRTFVTYHMRQRLRRACANLHSQYSVTHIPASTQIRATIGPPVKCHSNGGSLAGWWWPSLDKVWE